MLLYSALTVVFAYCSIVYQLFIAQSLTSTLGGTNFRYALTIGLYITSMGVAALFSKRFSKGNGGQALNLLMVVELALIFCGLACAPYVLVVEKFRIHSFDLYAGYLGEGMVAAFTGALSHAPIVLVGLLSGLELPYLMECSAARKSERGLGEQSRFQADILAFDYMGTVVGALLFPFILFPQFGIFGVSFLTAACNSAALFVLIAYSGLRSRLSNGIVIANAFLILVSIVAFLNRSSIHTILLQWLYY
jgi:spermidine synthase